MKKPVRILLVDDNPYFLDVARDYLQLQEAFEVAGVATDGQGALDQVEDLQPDVILLDLNLEQESSINLIPTIKQRRPDIKVIVITIMEVSSYRDAVLQAGADAFVSKSVMTHMLVPSIVNLLEQPAPPVLMSIKRDAPKFTQLIERSKDLIYRYEFFSIKGFSYVNPASEVLTGYTPEEHYADPELGNKLIHPEDRYLFEAIQRGEMPMEQPVVLRWVRKDGSILWTEQYIFPIYNDKGELVAIEGTASDITRQVADEQALREREILIHGIIDSAMDAIISIDANQKILSFNHAAEKMFQYSSAEIVGQSFDQLIPKRVREEYKKVWAENFGQTGVINRIMGRSENIYGLRKNGEEFLLETSISHMLFSGKHHYTLIIRDVTEQRQVEERLRQSERFIHSTLDALNAHIAVLDEMGRIIAVNRAWLEFTRANGGDPEKTGVGTNYLAVCDLASASTDEKYASEMAAGIRSVIHGERESFKMKYPCHAPQEDRWFMAYVTRFEDDGPLRIVIHHENVTEQMLAETTVSHQMSEISFYYENAPVGLAVLDTDLRFLKINQCLASINGLSIEEHIGKTVDEIVPSLVEQAKELAAEIMRSGEPHTNVEFTGETRAEPGIRHIWREGWYPLKAESGQVTGFQVVVEDITDHKQAEADLIAAENRFRTLIENNSDEISIISLEGSLIYESPSADPTLGYKSGEFLGQSIFQLLHPDDLERIQLLFARLIEQPYCQIRDQFRLLHRDGTWRWVEGVGTNLLSEPNVQGVVINYHDITDRKQIEDELRASRERFRQLADNIEEVFWITDARDGREIYMSPAAERVWGRSIGQLMQPRGFIETVLPDDHPAVLRALEEQRQGKKTELEYRIVQPDGSVRWVWDRAFPIIEPSGAVKLITGVTADITERKQVAETLREKERLLSEAQRIGRIGSWSYDLSSKMLQFSDEVYRLIGVPAERFDHTINGFMEVVHAEDRPNILRWIADVEAGRQIHELEIRIPDRKGKVQQFHISGAFVYNGGEKPIRYTGMIQDITERKQGEETLRLLNAELEQRVADRTVDLSRVNSQLENALRVKDEFLANMSHELRTPLNSIIGLAESLNEQMVGPLNEKQRKYLQTIGESGYHLLSLINDILDLAKIEAGKIALNYGNVNIKQVCEASLQMVHQMVQKKNQTVSFKMDDGLDLVWADERRLKQMLVNLLGNAVKFTQVNGQIGLEVYGERDTNTISFSVWDTGIGIKEEDHKRLFRPFEQLDSDLSREENGTGLGLVLVSQMAHLHGGSVQVESQFGAGSRFTISIPWEADLPTIKSSRNKKDGALRTARRGRKDEAKTILLVEDAEEVVMVMRDYLEYAGYRVITATNGIEGIEAARSFHPDLILMDVQMPVMDGLEATKKLRAIEEFQATPIIALTARAMPNEREMCLAAGMDEHITKPVHLKSMVKIVQKFMFESESLSG